VLSLSSTFTNFRKSLIFYNLIFGQLVMLYVTMLLKVKMHKLDSFFIENKDHLGAINVLCH